MGRVKSKFTDSERFIQFEVLAWALQNRWSLDVYDSKGTFSKARGRYAQNTGMKIGTPDLIGCDAHGRAVFLELKKHGHRSKCRLEQRQFLERKIDSNAFALVVDDVQYLQKVYLHFVSLSDLKERRDYLKSLLPKKVLINNKIVEVSSFSS